MKVDWYPSIDTEVVLSRNIQNIEPKSGWCQFTKKILDLGIKTLKNKNDFGMDGVTYCVEVAMKYEYRFYAYWSPESIKNKSVDDNSMIKILRLLEEECNFKRFQY